MNASTGPGPTGPGGPTHPGPPAPPNPTPPTRLMALLGSAAAVIEALVLRGAYPRSRPHRDIRRPYRPGVNPALATRPR
ncbi:hypothetical protein GCM10010168_86340 [Actinoplanes ianthinogenes]|uniref:Uncharacterized protein n=1 Tax=Actinoplanes ianthinogenes TaxID=122358 RepID=A0ABM7M1C1_9ACTN|nr:hypothetical protein Aiant_60220 [Actinoplanes ianthinogenes]GGR54036.1 hypothetical protein GCM10010168_86340 [Actinoplanes ianthinogenes]